MLQNTRPRTANVSENNPGNEFRTTRGFTRWLRFANCNIVTSCYRKHKLFCLGLQGSGEISTYYANMARPMGMTYADDKLICSNIGSLHMMADIGPENNPKWGYFDRAFHRQSTWWSGDADVHDIVFGNEGIFYISSLFNSIVKPSMFKSFEVFWTPPWITKNADGSPPAEDRCHLNGLCAVDGEPRFVTAASTSDYHGEWKHHHGEGVVYDIKNKEFVAKNLWAPHSPKWYNGNLWIGEAGTGHFGYVDLKEKKFVPCKFIPGFIRGITFYNDYALICTSFDRHDVAFKDIPLGRIIEAKAQKCIAGIHIINMKKFEIEEQFEFLDPKTELYDIVCIPNAKRLRIVDFLEDTRQVFSI